MFCKWLLICLSHVSDMIFLTVDSFAERFGNDDRRRQDTNLLIIFVTSTSHNVMITKNIQINNGNIYLYVKN